MKWEIVVPSSFLVNCPSRLPMSRCTYLETLYYIDVHGEDGNLGSSFTLFSPYSVHQSLCHPPSYHSKTSFMSFLHLLSVNDGPSSVSFPVTLCYENSEVVMSTICLQKMINHVIKRFPGPELLNILNFGSFPTSPATLMCQMTPPLMNSYLKPRTWGRRALTLICSCPLIT